MWFNKTRERRILLKFLYDVYSDKSRQFANWIEEIAFQLKPEIDRQRLKAYLDIFSENEWIEWDKERPEAYIITSKGRVYHSSSSWSRLSTNKKIKIIGIIVGSTLALLGFYLRYACA